MKSEKDAALAEFKRSIQLDHLDPRVPYHLATVYLQGKQYEKALRTFRDLRTRAPDYLHIHYQLGQTHAVLNQWDQAGEEFMLALRQGALPDGAQPMTLIEMLVRTQIWDAKKHAAIVRELAPIYPNDKPLKQALNSLSDSGTP